MQRKTLVALLTVLAPLVGVAQSQSSLPPSRSDPVDVQARFGVQANLNLTKKWDASIGYEGRMVSDASIYSGAYFDGELQRSFGKQLTMFGNYRYARLTGAQSHRVGAG